MDCLFFLSEPHNTMQELSPLNENYEVVIWRPSLLNIKPKELGWIPFFVWWILHVFRIFANRRYALLLIYKNKSLIHHSCIFPKYNRFPFMDKADLQVGDTWTAPEERGKGLAAHALSIILKEYANDTRVWYLTEENNQPSIKVAEKCGFHLYAKGQRCKYLGISLLGNYNFKKNDVIIR